MSELTVGQLRGLPVNNNVITVPSGHQLYAPGSVVQVQTIRSDARVTMSSNPSGNGTTITQLGVSITPKFANSKLIVQWMINCEIQENNVFLVHKNGELIITSGETGYNSEAGNVRYSGVASAAYDTDSDSTMSSFFIQYFCTSGSTGTQVFAPAVRSANANTSTLALNRTLGTLGSDNRENTISTGTVWEIAQ
jgi:hypothetical protein